MGLPPLPPTVAELQARGEALAAQLARQRDRRVAAVREQGWLLRLARLPGTVRKFERVRAVQGEAFGARWRGAWRDAWRALTRRSGPTLC